MGKGQTGPERQNPDWTSRLHGESTPICREGAVGLEVRDQIMEMLDPGLDPVHMGSNGRLAGEGSAELMAASTSDAPGVQER